jgi:hypothetical protein
MLARPSGLYLSSSSVKVPISTIGWPWEGAWPVLARRWILLHSIIQRSTMLVLVNQVPAGVCMAGKP